MPQAPAPPTLTDVETSPARRSPSAWALAVLAALVVVVYARTLTADFVNWDDPINVVANPRVTEIAGVVRSWTSAENPEFLPLTYTIFWAEWHLGGGAPWLFHLDNVLLHAGAAVMVALLAAELGLAPVAAWLAAGLFALHPMQVTSVAWVTERKNVLYGLLWLASLVLYLRSGSPAASGRPTGRTAYLLSIVAFILAMASKRAAATLPAAIVVVEWARGRRLDRRFWSTLAPYVAVALAGAIGLVLRVPEGVHGPALPMRLALACRALWFYMLSFFWPAGVMPVYPHWSLEEIGGETVVAVAATVGVGGALAVWRRRIPSAVAIGLGLYLTNVVLVVGLVWFTFFRTAMVSDHLAYLPSVGLALAAVATLEALAPRLRVPARALHVAVGLWCAGLAVLASQQIPKWHDSETLWTSALATNPDCIPCNVNLGMLRREQGDLAAAGRHLERALAIEAEAQTMVRLAGVRMAEGRLADAQALYERSIRVDPSRAGTHYDLGNALRRQGKLEEAIASYRESLRLQPGQSDAHHNLGLALRAAGRLEEAETELEEALRLSPGDVDAEVNLGMVAAARGDAAGAIARYREALAHVDDDAKRTAIVSALAEALLAAGRSEEAVRALEEGVARSPDAVELLGLLAWQRATSADPTLRKGDEAVRLAERACGLTNHQDADLMDTLAAAYAEAGRFADAAQAGRVALELAKGTEAADEISERVARYGMGKPYRQP